MEATEYKCTFKNKHYVINKALFKTMLHPICITVQESTHKLQAFIYPQNQKTVISYTTPNVPNELATVLYVFLRHINIPSPDFPTAPTLYFEKTKTDNYENTIIYSTNTYTFRATIKEELYHYYVKIGGKDFVGCIELFIYKQESESKLAQIYSEPECWHNLGEKGSTVDMIKGALQLCQMLFGTNIFSFDDKSNVECGETYETKKLPRKFTNPFSLTYLSIAEKGKTWYENYFNAFLKDTRIREKYAQSIQQLQNPDAKPDYTTFLKKSVLSNEQQNYLKPMYENSNTWKEFFAQVPKEKQCVAFYNWLPMYMSQHILKMSPTKHEWCIYLGNLGISDFETTSQMTPMVRTDMIIEMKPSIIKQWGGKRKQTVKKDYIRNATRKMKTVPLVFSNEHSCGYF